MATPQFKTLVYSPDVRIYIEGTDVSRDVVRGGVNRITGGASSLQFTLSNLGLRYNNKFRRMDRVAIWMKRISWQLVFTGYLDSVPGIQLYPTTVSFRASCTIKRILYASWDPGLPESQKLLNQRAIPFGAGAAAAGTTTPQTDAANTTPGANPPAPTTGTSDNATTPTPQGSGTAAGAVPGLVDTTQAKDSGIGDMLKNVLEKVGGWDRDQVFVQEFPTSFLGYISEQLPEIEKLDANAVADFKKMFDYDEPTGAGAPGAAGATGGSLAGATFTTIGPPANGQNYSDSEIVWIVTNAGWRGEDVVIGSSIIKAESGGDPDAVNTANSDGSTDRGLWQINSIHDGMFPGENRMDPAVSTKIARKLYENRGNWNDWSTLVYHGTAQQHFDTFRAIAGSGGTAPPNSGTTAGGAAPAPATPAAPVTAPASPTAPAAPPAALGSYGLPGGTNVSYGAPGFPDWVYALSKQFNVQASTYPGHQEDQRNEAGYAPNPDRQNRGIDWSGGIPEMQRFAEHLLSIAPNTPALEQIIWQNPGTGARIGWYGRSPDSSGSYFASAYPDHTDHVHTRQSAALDGSASMAGAGSTSTSGGGTGSTFQNKLAKNLFTYIFDGAGYDQTLSLALKGKYASVNDEPLIQVIRQLCEAGMRDFQSSPSGQFLAFYPDYFGLDNTAPKFKIEDVEMKNFKIDINDDALTTHVFTMGSDTFSGSVAPNELGYMRSPGVVTVEDEFLFKRATQGSFFLPETTDAQELMSRYGVRPLKKQYRNLVQAPPNQATMLLVAIKLFMERWAEQYQTTVEFTFMPELFPGMRVELVGHDLVVYVKSVSHSFDFESGFSTSAQVMAPMSASRTAIRTGEEGDS